ncbi:rRNA maturation RNase YbeY [Algivirga pacifica]|uniref:Endoribonuclease YbeY n=1 Tax=Algivirga pacifica TaxID=1162670 RepID=A0ABP9D5C9_9BACT
MEQIQFFQEDVSFDLQYEEKVKQWIVQVIEDYSFSIEEINYIFCSDEYLHKINVEYLDHDTYTDIITFDNSDQESTIASDIFISIDRVKDNAESFSGSVEDELHRVMIHGVLHLLGFKDKTEEEATEMRRLESLQLEKRSF